MGLTIFTWIVMLVIVGSAVAVFVVLGKWPGEIAQERNHPNATAVKVAGWLGVLTGGVLWPLAFIWAWAHEPRVSVKELQPGGADSETATLNEAVQALAARVEALERKEG